VSAYGGEIRLNQWPPIHEDTPMSTDTRLTTSVAAAFATAMLAVSPATHAAGRDTAPAGALAPDARAAGAISDQLQPSLAAVRQLERLAKRTQFRPWGENWFEVVFVEASPDLV
jgi:hypothetical protein